jgi:aminopeptidase-like protein
MNVRDFVSPDSLAGIGESMHAFIGELYPICRSITGNGTRETLRRIGERIPLEMNEVRTGTPVFDWTIPREWNIRDAYVMNSRGEKVIDFAKSNLHVLNYSMPMRGEMSLAELRGHLFIAPDHPEWIPYKTSYYKDDWGFCLAANQLASLPEGRYEVVVDTSLEDGHLTYGECLIRGESDDEVLLSCHVCHPSLCNDNLSGIALCTFLAAHLLGQRLRYSYRFLFIPGTIGAITWLARNEYAARRIRHGIVAACVGDRGMMNYKRSRQGNAEIDRVVTHVLKHSGLPHGVADFSPYGYDERQFCSPGFDLPVGSLTRTPHGRFPEYHTSADNLDLVRPESLADSFEKYAAVLRTLEQNRTYINQNPKCEPQLGRRGLYRLLGGNVHAAEMELALLWVLNQSDGTRSLLDIAERANMRFELLHSAAQQLQDAGLLKDCKVSTPRSN